MLPGVFDRLFVVAIDILASVGFAVCEVQTELTIHVISGDRIIAMWNAIQGTGIGMTIHVYQTRPSTPQIPGRNLIRS